MVTQKIDLNIIPNWRGVTIKERQNVVDPKLPINGIIGSPADRPSSGRRIKPHDIIMAFSGDEVRFQVTYIDWDKQVAEISSPEEIPNIDDCLLSLAFKIDDWYDAKGDIRSKLNDVIGAYIVTKQSQEEAKMIPGSEVGGIIRD